MTIDEAKKKISDSTQIKINFLSETDNRLLEVRKCEGFIEGYEAGVKAAIAVAFDFIELQECVCFEEVDEHKCERCRILLKFNSLFEKP